MTIQELSAQLLQINDQFATRKKLRRNLKSVQSSLEEERARLKSLTKLLRKESRDVARLEGLSLTGLFHEILGSKEEQLDKERREELAARLKLSQCAHAVEALTEESSEITRKLSELGDLKQLDAQYESVLKEKEKLLLDKGGADAGQLLALAEKAATLHVSQKELAEAVLAGEGVLNGLERVVHSLNSARSWGTWDMLGGGLIATAVKHSRIDDARDQVQEVQALALRFERELADVQLDIDVPLQFNSFTKFADYFFDNLITDWIVNSRIEESRNSARTAYAKVEEIMAQLLKRFSDVKSQMNAAEEERRTFVEEA